LNQKTRPNDVVVPPATLVPDRAAEATGVLICHRCGGLARWHSWGDAWIAACVAHAPEDDYT
jgi:hypothetical protein